MTRKRQLAESLVARVCKRVRCYRRKVENLPLCYVTVTVVFQKFSHRNNGFFRKAEKIFKNFLRKFEYKFDQLIFLTSWCRFFSPGLC